MAFPGSTFPNSCNRAPLRRFLPTPQRMRASTGLHTPSKAHFPRDPRGSYTPNKAHFSASPLAPHLSTGFRMANRTNFFNKPPYAERNARLRQASICQTGRHRLPERAFDCPNAHFIQGQCHVRIAGCSLFLTFHAGVGNIGPLSRDRRPFKRNQLQKEADLLLLKTGARPKRNSRRDVGLCSYRDVGS